MNAFIAGGNLPPEYALLGVTPDPWEAWHSIAVLRQGGLLLNSVYPETWRAIALPTLGADGLHRLRMDDGGDELVCMPPGTEAQRLMPDMAALAEALAASMADGDPDAAGDCGSNNWAVHGSRTQGGRPMVCRDPHRMLDMPSMYQQCHLACDSFDVIGLTTPGVPGFPHCAHNREVAWCVTVAFLDSADIYLEGFTGDADRYLQRADADGDNAQCADVERRAERIDVRDQSAVDGDMYTSLSRAKGQLGQAWGPADLQNVFGEAGKNVTALAYLSAIQALQRVSRGVGEQFQQRDVLSTPVCATPPHRLGEVDLEASELESYKATERKHTGYTSIQNVTGQPAMSVPLHWSKSGLPIGVQFTGRFGDEATLLQLAGQLERAAPWWDKLPTAHLR